jgi:BNR repeat-like domain
MGRRSMKLERRLFGVRLERRRAGLFCLWLALPLLGGAQPVEVLPPELRGSIQPQVAVGPGQDIFVTFGKGASIYCTASSDGGQRFRAPVEIARLPSLALGLRRGPRLAVTGHQVTVSAISHETGDLYSWTSNDGGVRWSEAVVINSVPKAAREGLHAMAGNGRDRLYAVWLDSRNRGNQVWLAASEDAGRNWGRNVMVYQSPDGHVCECCHPSIVVLANGHVRVMWRNWLGGARDLYAATSRDQGKTFSAAEKLGSGTWRLNACPMDGGGLAGPYSVWRRQSSVFYTDAGAGEHLLDTRGRQPVVSLGKGGPYFVWERGSQLMLNRGTVVKPVALASPGAYAAIAAKSEQAAPVAVWESITNGVKTILATEVK